MRALLWEYLTALQLMATFTIKFPILVIGWLLVAGVGYWLFGVISSASFTLAVYLLSPGIITSVIAGGAWVVAFAIWVSEKMPKLAKAKTK